MDLFERIKELNAISEKGGTPLYRELGINVHTFRAYLKKDRQNNLFPLLDKILAIHPEISRNWLWFGEGQMLASSDDLDNEKEQELLDELGALRQKVTNLEEVSALKDELIAAQKQALQSKEEVLNLYRKFYAAEAPTQKQPAGAARSLPGVVRSTPKRTKDNP